MPEQWYVGEASLPRHNFLREQFKNFLFPIDKPGINPYNPIYQLGNIEKGGNKELKNQKKLPVVNGDMRCCCLRERVNTVSVDKVQ